jgi:hypothetical protein
MLNVSSKKEFQISTTNKLFLVDIVNVRVLFTTTINSFVFLFVSHVNKQQPFYNLNSFLLLTFASLSLPPVYLSNSFVASLTVFVSLQGSIL